MGFPETFPVARRALLSAHVALRRRGACLPSRGDGIALLSNDQADFALLPETDTNPPILTLFIRLAGSELAPAFQFRTAPKCARVERFGGRVAGFCNSSVAHRRSPHKWPGVAS